MKLNMIQHVINYVFQHRYHMYSIRWLGDGRINNYLKCKFLQNDSNVNGEEGFITSHSFKFGY
jgi:hypothetical protein